MAPRPHTIMTAPQYKFTLRSKLRAPHHLPPQAEADGEDKRAVNDDEENVDWSDVHRALRRAYLAGGAAKLPGKRASMYVTWPLILLNQ
jgi:hypothetical protein